MSFDLDAYLARIGLTERHYQRSDGADAGEKMIADADHYRRALADTFGLKLTAEEVAVLWATM